MQLSLVGVIPNNCRGIFFKTVSILVNIYLSHSFAYFIKHITQKSELLVILEYCTHTHTHMLMEEIINAKFN